MLNMAERYFPVSIDSWAEIKGINLEEKEKGTVDISKTSPKEINP